MLHPHFFGDYTTGKISLKPGNRVSDCGTAHQIWYRAPGRAHSGQHVGFPVSPTTGTTDDTKGGRPWRGKITGSLHRQPTRRTATTNLAPVPGHRSQFYQMEARLARNLQDSHVAISLSRDDRQLRNPRATNCGKRKD